MPVDCHHNQPASLVLSILNQLIIQGFGIVCAVLLVAAFFLVNLAARSEAMMITSDRLAPLVIAHVLEKTHNRQVVQGAATEGKASDETIAVDVLQVPGAPFSFPDDSSLKITLSSTAWDNLWCDRGIVRVRMEDKAGHSRELGVPVHLRITKSVWVVKSPVSANTPLRACDFTVVRRDVSLNYGYMLGSNQDLNSYMARVNLNPGEVLDTRKIAIPPDVHYNEEIRLIITDHNNDMTLSIPGIALAEGRIGQTIRVRQALYQRKARIGKIIDKGQVLIEM
jgi:flagella basal body P-ring formation protein FlgA